MDFPSRTRRTANLGRRIGSVKRLGGPLAYADVMGSKLAKPIPFGRERL
jgi:hypothetical protein